MSFVRVATQAVHISACCTAVLYRPNSCFASSLASRSRCFEQGGVELGREGAALDRRGRLRNVGSAKGEQQTENGRAT